MLLSRTGVRDQKYHTGAWRFAPCKADFERKKTIETIVLKSKFGTSLSNMVHELLCELGSKILSRICILEFEPCIVGPYSFVLDAEEACFHQNIYPTSRGPSIFLASRLT